MELDPFEGPEVTNGEATMPHPSRVALVPRNGQKSIWIGMATWTYSLLTAMAAGFWCSKRPKPKTGKNVQTGAQGWPALKALGAPA